MNSLSASLGSAVGASLLFGALRWRFSETGREALRPEHLQLQRHLEQSTTSIVKHGPHRTVYRIQLDGLNIFWKHCRISGLSAYLRQWIRPPKARLEFDRAQALRARGIDAVEPLAWAGPRYRFVGPSHLITREVAGAIPLQTYLQERSQGPARREAAVLLGRYLGRLHENGVAHPDLHPGNILVVAETGGPRFYLLDIHNIRRGRPLSIRASRANLVILNRWFVMRSQRSDRCRFCQGYAEARGLGRDDARDLARGVEKRTFLSNLELWMERDDRSFASNRYFRRVRSWKARGHAVKEFDEATLKRLLADPDAPFREPGVKLLKDSATSTVAEIVVATSDGPRAMIYKRFRLKKPLAPLMNLVRLSPALRSWRMGHALINRCLPTPRPWLVLHRRGLGAPREGYLLCDKVAGAIDAREFLLSLFNRPKWDAIAQLGRLLHRFHEAGLAHRDLKAANLLATANDGTFHFIDLVGVYSHKGVKEATRARNLSRLNVSFLQDAHFTRTDCLRFLRAYLCWGLHGADGWKKWWNQIAAASRAKIERNRKTGRPVT